MAADVSHVVQILGRYKEEGEDEAKAGSLVTRDLLGGCSVSGEKKPDLDLKVPGGWEERLDPMSSEESRSSLPATTTAANNRQVLNPPPLFMTFTPPSPNLDLKLFTPSSSTCPTTAFNHSVCTLDKVKSALERAAKSNPPHAKRGCSLSPTSSSTTTTTTTTTSTTVNNKTADKGQRQEEEVVEEPRSSVSEGPSMGEPTAPMAAGCPGCLSYVLVSKDNPRCPRCRSRVPFPARKKPRIELDLNSYTMTAPPS